MLDIRALIVLFIIWGPALALPVVLAVFVIVRRGRPKQVRLRTALIAIGLYVLVVAMLPLMAWSELFGTSPRVECQKNLMQIGLAVMQYAGENDGKFPESLRVLLNEGYIKDARLLLCPGSGRRVPKSYAKPAFESMNAEGVGRVADWSDYVLVPGLTQKSEPRCILIYDKPGNHKSGGSNVFFVDGHTEWLEAAELARLLAACPSPARPEDSIRP